MGLQMRILISSQYYHPAYALGGTVANAVALAEGLARLIQEVCSKSPTELQQFGQRAREFVLQNKNWARQGQRIYEFISAL